MFEDLRTRYPSTVGQRGFDRFVRDEFIEKVRDLTQQQALGLVEATYFQSFMWLAVGEEDRSTG